MSTITSLQASDDGAASLAIINDNFAELENALPAPGGSDTQLQFNDDGVLGGARLGYSETESSVNVLTPTNTNGSLRMISNGTGVVGAWSGNNEIRYSIANNGMFFENDTNSLFHFYNAGFRAGILDFSAVTSTNKTFTFPNKIGNVTVTSTGIGEQKVIYKSADETVNNSDTLQNDDHLTFAVGANEVWAVELFVKFTSSADADFQYYFGVPAGATFQGWASYEYGVIGNSTSNTSATFVPGDGSTIKGDTFKGVIENGATPGDVVFRWSQRVAEVSDTKVLKGSYIIAHRLA
jgi:hypothetical protein